MSVLIEWVKFNYWYVIVYLNVYVSLLIRLNLLFVYVDFFDMYDFMIDYYKIVILIWIIFLYIKFNWW